jgi:hypothetical protein
MCTPTDGVSIRLAPNTVIGIRKREDIESSTMKQALTQGLLAGQVKA